MGTFAKAFAIGARTYELYRDADGYELVDETGKVIAEFADEPDAVAVVAAIADIAEANDDAAA